MIEFPKFRAVRALVYGDVMLDRYWYGNSSRISPEAPVPVVNVDSVELRVGGAANVAANIAALGSQVSLFGIVGDDVEGEQLRQLAKKQGIDWQCLTVDNHKTTAKLRIWGQNQQLLRMDFERTDIQLDDASLVAMYQQALTNIDVIVLSDYAKGALWQVQRLIQLARGQNVPVLVDPKLSDWTAYTGATVVTPNLKEFEALVGPCKSDEILETRARDVLERYQLQALLITRGKAGMVLIQRDEPLLNLQAEARDVYDVSGAGDTVIATLAATLAAQQSLSVAANIANTAAGIVVGKLGTETVLPDELQYALYHQHSDRYRGVLATENLSAVLSYARAQGERIVMTNGCFDILHAGHVQYLEQAKALGDRLLIAVNDDDSVRRLKGDTRPVNTLQDRMAVLAALRAVDWVVPFSEDTPARLIGEVLPDHLVKAADYEIDEIAGADVVLANGGEVSTLPLKSGCSTTGLIEKITKNSGEPA